jgi:cytochrome P450
MRAPLYSPNPNELFELATIADPQPLYARLRAEAPLSRIGDTGVHLVSTWSLVEEALAREQDFSANLTGVLIRGADDRPTIFELPAESVGNAVIATADEPDHSVHRGLVQPRFASGLVERLEEKVRDWAREAVAEWLAGGAGDFVPVAELVPARVVGELLGLPDGDVSRFRTWAMLGGDMLAGDADLERLTQLSRESIRMGEYLGEHLDRAGRARREDPDAPMLHALAGGVESGMIPRGAAIGIATTMFGAGGESTAALIGATVRALAERPGLAGKLRADRTLVPRFVEEIARLDPPFNFHYRVVRRDCELGGCTLERGDRLMLLWASANRDPERIEDPDALRFDRRHPKNHLTFGRGSHFCIGAPVARMEARLVCEALLDATRALRLQPDREPVYANSIFVHRLEQLSLEATAAA